MKTTINSDQVIGAIQHAIEDEADDVIRLLAQHLDPALCRIETNDESPAALDESGALWVTSDHTLLYDGETVAEWTRCARGDYGDQGRSECINDWCVSEDTNGGDRLPEMVEIILDAIGLTDPLTDVPEPPLADTIHAEDPDGEYAVYWETAIEGSGPARRYATLEAAEAVAEQSARELAASNPGHLLCGYSVRQLVDGEWESIESE